MRTLILKLGALFSFCGGPLAACDALKPVLGDPANFVVCVAPIAAMLFAVFAMDEPRTRATLAVVALGALGACAVLGMDLWASFTLGLVPDRPDGTLIALGNAVGLGCVAAFGRRLVQWAPRS